MTDRANITNVMIQKITQTPLKTYIWSWAVVKVKINVMYFFLLRISHKWWQIGRALLLPANRKSRKHFWRHNIWLCPILKVNVMHISTSNISQTVTYRASITIAIKQDVSFAFVWQSYYIVTIDIDPFKRSNSKLSSDIFRLYHLANVDGYGKHYSGNQIESSKCAFYWCAFIFDLVPKDQGQRRAHLDRNYLADGHKRVSITTVIDYDVIKALVAKLSIFNYISRIIVKKKSPMRFPADVRRWVVP